MTIQQFCEEHNMTTRELFHEAYKKENGKIFALEGPEKLHSIWLRQNSVIPIYVLRYIKHKLEQEAYQQLVPE